MVVVIWWQYNIVGDATLAHYLENVAGSLLLGSLKFQAGCLVLCRHVSNHVS